ncbi:hypothetical protein BT96DRAFT_1025968 [Gymnopus androsaceus JB14]|uniref:BZIP domain-containing protein n=1 Tax=Gymnopus androsaceus JB14 TaxID=1447944 RepID=A0A6A4GNW6_9AGAR|nr:hypothetical protein BT96DRAFT_1025968 [Gymnopus androsaceus JB14]
MLVDNPMMQQPSSSLFADSPNTNNNGSGLAGIEEFLNTELFGPSSLNTMSMSPASTSSRASSPSDSLSQILSTPPQAPLENSFPDPYSFLGNQNFGFGGGFGGGMDAGTAPPSFFNFLDEEIKVDSSSSNSFSPFDPPSTGNTGLPFDFMSAFGGPSTSPGAAMAIDPQLVDSPSTHADGDEEEMAEPESEEPATATKKATRSSTKAASSKPDEKDEKLTLTIAPVKVGGHGKARKGTVQGGGITKKVAVPTPAPNPASTSSFFPSTSTLSGNKENNFSSASSNKDSDEKDDDDDLPADWRPPPEVFAKMTSKEKRQLRNKISARNFRVRRKEYISTLEMDIAERDRLLQAIRSELGSTQSENLALRQEVAALKRALLEGRQTGTAHTAAVGATPLSPTSLRSRSSSPTLSIRGADVNLNTAAVTLDDLNLPPPAPLPERSAAEELAARAAAAVNASSSSPSSSTSSPSASSSHLLIPNTQKDLPTSPRVHANSASAFWGGVSQAGFGGFAGGAGYTPVHTVLMPDLNMHTEANLSIGQWVRDVVAANAAASGSLEQSQSGVLQENMNPTMNASASASGQGQQHAGFDGFVDTNPFTMKTLDAYRMQLWTKMAASTSSNTNANPLPTSQQQQQQQQYLAAAQAQAQQQQYSQQRKALERESLSPSPFTLPSHQPGANAHPNAHGTHLNGLASSLKPAYFVNSNKPNLPATPTRNVFSSPLSALLAGKHSPPSAFGSAFVSGAASGASAYPSPPSSPNLSGKTPSSPRIGSPSPSSSSSASSSKISQPQLTPAQMQQAQSAMYAAALASTASQTLLGKLGSAFWDAFSGSGSSTGAGPNASTSGGSTNTGGVGNGAKPWDVDKVRKVLEGKAVVRVVDVDEHVVKKNLGESMSTPAPISRMHSNMAQECSMTALLEESMRSLTLGEEVGECFHTYTYALRTGSGLVDQSLTLTLISSSFHFFVL